MARSFLRLQASAARPSGTPTAAYRRVKAVPSQPSWVSLNPHSLRMASLTAPSIWRSKKFIALIANSNQRANRARARSLSILGFLGAPKFHNSVKFASGPVGSEDLTIASRPHTAEGREPPMHADERRRTSACIRVHRRFQTAALVPFLFYQPCLSDEIRPFCELCVHQVDLA